MHLYSSLTRKSSRFTIHFWYAYLQYSTFLHLCLET